MYKAFIKSLQAWNVEQNERQKLQYGYLAGAVAVIVLAGLIGLFDYSLGQQLTAVALLLFGVFMVNLVVWTLLDGLVIAKLNKPAQRTTKTATSRKRK